MRVRLWVAVLFALLLAGCGSPVPSDKAGYVGEWRAKDRVLVITQDGNVRYKRRDGSSNIGIDAPIKRFEGNNFVVGIGPFSTTFVVSKPPYQAGNVWKMVVDGVELLRGGIKEDWKA